MKNLEMVSEHSDCGTPDCCGQCSTADKKDIPEIPIFNKQMKPVTNNEFGG
jgi:hypothetical protein